MKTAPYIRRSLIIIVSTLLPFFSLAQPLYWQGQSENWNDLENWRDAKGAKAEHLPSAQTHVFFPVQSAGTINLQNQEIEIASLTGLNLAHLTLESNQASTLIISGSLNLGEEISLGSNINFQLTGQGYSNPTLSIPSNLENHLSVLPDHYQRISGSVGPLGSCPFFDLTADPTPPTCNGFENGIAAVLEPTTGVGPYTYQWIGGPTTREWTNVGAGTYTVLVFDQGQGGTPCNIDVFVNEPGPLTLFSLNETPPTCADLCNGQASPIIIGGNGGYILTWSNGESGFSPSALCAVFTLNIEDVEGCVFDTTLAFSNLPDPILIDETITDVTCFGANDGLIDITGSGGTGTLGFSWTGPSGFNSISEDISNLEPGDYTLEVTDDNGCTVNETYTVIENPVLLVSAISTNNLCNGDDTGSIDLTIAGGLSPYDISWTGPGGFVSTDQDIVDLIAGTYEVTVTDAANCVVVIQETVNEPDPLTAVITPSNLQCFENNSGELTALAQGGTPGYNYSWVGPNGFTGLGPTIIGLSAGTYSLTVTDNINCVFTIDVDLVEPDELILNFLETPISCNGDSDGEIDLTVLGGTASFTFSWTGPGGFTSTNEDITGLATGIYTIEVTDFNSCVISESYDLIEPQPIALSAALSNPDCAAENTGAIDLTIANGTPPYNVLWFGPSGFSSTDEDIAGLSAGDYTVIVDDSGGCSITETYTIIAPSGLSAVFTLTPVSCFGGANGAVITTSSGGTPPYTFFWLGPSGFNSSDQNLNGLVAGEYSLLLSDDSGCNGFFSVTIIQPSNISVSNTITDISCFGGSDGGISITPSGASSPYSFAWSGPGGFSASSQNISGLAAGDYTVLITDDSNCEFSRTYTVNEPDQIAIDAAITDVVCVGDFTGAINITISGGSPGFIRSWTGPNGFTAITEDINGLEAGSYTVNITDSQGCIASATFTVQELFDVELSSVPTDISCFGVSDGAIDLSPSGGQLPFTFDWTGPNGFTSADEDLADLEAGIYIVLVTDDNGCEETAQVEIFEPSEIVLDITVTNIDCFGDADGAITVSTTGGTSTLDFSWIGPNGFTSSNQNLSGLEPGDYEVTVEDANGCSVIEIVTISENSELTVIVETFDSNCQQFDGLAVATASGGTGVLTFSWENEAGVEIVQNDSLIDVQGGTYEVIVTDELGCSIQLTAVISDNNGTLTGTVTNPTCSGGNDGAIDTELTGGTGSFDYVWTDGNGFTSDQEDITDLVAGTYILSITDANNCVFSETFEVVDPVAISVDAIATEVSCIGSDGSINLSIQNATEPFDINWTGPNGFIGTGASLGDLEPGDYDYILTDALGCSAAGIVSISSAPSITVVETVTNITCAGDMDGAISLEVSGGSPPLQFSWTSLDGFISSSEDISNLSPGEYSLTVTDQSTCVESLTLTVTEPDSILVDIAISEPDCIQANGSLEAFITGGTISGTYVIIWEDDLGNLISNSTLAENLSPGNYTLTVTDDNGCIYQEEITLSNPGGDITATISPVTCGGGLDGAIDLEIANVAEPFTVSWTGPNGFVSNDEDIMNLAGGSYSYTVSGADGCVFTESLEVSSPEALDVLLSITNTCFDENNGQIEIEISGGEEPYTILWNGPNSFTSNELAIAELVPGDYDLQIIDNAGCDFTGVYTVSENPEIITEITAQNIACFGETNGSIDLTLTSGLSPFTIEWLGPDGFISSVEDITALGSGEYTLTVTDFNGCFTQDTIALEQPDELVVVEEVIASGCSDEPNSGSISLFPEGGQPGYIVEWTGPNGFTSSLFDIVNLSIGTYVYTVTDQGGCVMNNSIDIVEVEPLSLDVNSINPACFGFATGTIETLIGGGLTPYQIIWTGPNGFEATTDTIENLVAGEYSLTVIDQAGCELGEIIILTQPEPISLELNSAAATCFNVADGSIEAIVTGGTADYTFLWTGLDGFESDQGNITSLFQGEYIFTVTDASGCEFSDTSNVDVLFSLDLNAGADTAFCPSDLPATLTGELVGGDEFYWTLNGDTISSTSQVIVDETYEGITEFILIGSNGTCSETDTITIEILESPEVDAGEDLHVFIEEVFTLGGDPTSPDEVTYLWVPNPMSVFDSASSNPTGFLLESVDFVVTVTDVNGCQSTDTVLVEVLPDIEVTSGFTPNGDGVNDSWIIDNIELFPSMVVHVFNRWGVEVFESQGYNANIAWGGTYEGSILPSGTYYFTIELNDPRFPDPITGPLTLHR
ncbi:MAG: gliding motility-associated-like protein [Cryomorphaceae bacterium]|jgi:gliding motility-associated-like protein